MDGHDEQPASRFDARDFWEIGESGAPPPFGSHGTLCDRGPRTGLGLEVGGELVRLS